MWPWRRRFLFRYHDGRKRTAADPLVLYRRLLKHGEELVVSAAAFDRQQDPEAEEFIRRLAEIFALVRYDPETGRGLTDAEIVAVFERFNGFLREVRERFFLDRPRRRLRLGGPPLRRRPHAGPAVAPSPGDGETASPLAAGVAGLPGDRDGVGGDSQGGLRGRGGGRGGRRAGLRDVPGLPATGTGIVKRIACGRTRGCWVHSPRS